MNNNVKSPCGAADLLAAVFGEDPDIIRAKYNLPLKYPKLPTCPICGKNMTKAGCRHRHLIPVACDECGKITEWSERKVINKLTHGQKIFFCNNTCFGRWAGKHYGFAVHPENTNGSSRRKHDYKAIWEKHLETGFGPSRLSRMLGIDIGVISYILIKMRKETVNIVKAK
ncbi:MAG: hypothetical protein PHI12_08470 [Dehalococcoidales bacterium]|nr:hypothetical protein [Dehalococcoidales bacterium]